MTRHRVAVVGLGFGLAHIAAYRQLADRFEVVAVCDHGQDRLDGLATWFDVPVRTTSFDDIVALDEVDVIDICTPPATHVDMITAGLERGRHVICEKPLTGSLAEVDLLAEREKASQGRLMPIFQYRFGDGAGRLRRLIELEVTGRAHVASVETFWHRGADYYASPWRGTLDTELGGVCAMHAIHAYDLLLTLLGPVRSVFARTATRINPVETEDCAAVVVEFESGALATLTATLGSARELSRMRIHFDHLSVESGLSPYGGSAEPWTIEAMSTDAVVRIDAAL
ncbi:MAG: Gfo/Idh/MocA family oxidoreductase, partial [Acidimicrobiia bacterium]|nr:Gfo/Idh/MocA family oxidoreductase [Acidimicrobiia bacterium]